MSRQDHEEPSSFIPEVLVLCKKKKKKIHILFTLKESGLKTKQQKMLPSKSVLQTFWIYKAKDSIKVRVGINVV